MFHVTGRFAREDAPEPGAVGNRACPRGVADQRDDAPNIDAAAGAGLALAGPAGAGGLESCAPATLFSCFALATVCALFKAADIDRSITNFADYPSPDRQDRI